jgi:uncharacterized protein (DUF1501 family)
MAYTGRLEVGLQTVRAIIKGWLQITFPAASTGLILRIRRGFGTTGVVVAGGNTETAGVAAGKIGDYALHFSEQILNAEFVDYSLTAAITGTGNNTAAQITTIEGELLTSG